MPDPYLAIGPFTIQFGRTLTAAETPVATRLLQVVSDWIRARKPDADQGAAAQVAFEVVRDSITFGDLDKFSSFQNITSRRQESGTFDPAMRAVNDYLTTKHKRLLGITTVPEPLYNFPECDY